MRMGEGSVSLEITEEKVISILEDAVDGCAGCRAIPLRSPELCLERARTHGPIWTLRLLLLLADGATSAVLALCWLE